MTVRRLWRAVEARTAAEWNRFAHLMAAAFWSQGHRVDPDEMNPLKQDRQSADSSEVELDSTNKDTVIASRIKVASDPRE